MKPVKITVIRKACYPDLIEKYENPLDNPCDMRENDVYISKRMEKPEGFCSSAWDSISAFVMALSNGAENIYDGWMKNPKSVMLSCNDGFRPVSFLLEVLDAE